MGVPPSSPSFSLRAFYLERSNLPTDASTTAVKIDQVCPLGLPRAGASKGQAGPRVAPQPESWPSSLHSPTSRKSPGITSTPF